VPTSRARSSPGTVPLRRAAHYLQACSPDRSHHDSPGRCHEEAWHVAAGVRRRAGGRTRRRRAFVRAAVDRLPPPDSKVGYRYVRVSPQGHLWVRQPGRPDGPVDWIVYDLEARPIGRVTTPAGFQIHERCTTPRGTVATPEAWSSSTGG